MTYSITLLVRLTNVTADNFHFLITIHVGHETQAKAFLVSGIRESVHGETGASGAEHVSHAGVQLVVVDLTPKLGFLVVYAFGGRAVNVIVGHFLVCVRAWIGVYIVCRVNLSLKISEFIRFLKPPQY